jgi:hypothetical protein
MAKKKEKENWYQPSIKVISTFGCLCLNYTEKEKIMKKLLFTATKVILLHKDVNRFFPTGKSP